MLVALQLHSTQPDQVYGGGASRGVDAQLQSLVCLDFARDFQLPSWHLLKLEQR